MIRNSYMSLDALDTSRIDPRTATYLLEEYLQHHYDLLGSGWIEFSYQNEARGLEGHKYDMRLPFNVFDSQGMWLNHILMQSHVESARRIWSQVSREYRPIDWQRDPKSGYRWNTKTWYLDQRVGRHPGADIKMPWEISRMQHLPQMAVFCKMFPELARVIIQEFRDQVLDFIATNPPRMGVNWTCTMDVGIRAANMLLAFDLLKGVDKDEKLDSFFIQTLSDSIYEHGVHIVNNLEYFPHLRSNHYLANLAGLLFVSAYLERDTETDCWLDFAVRALVWEMALQFKPDGSNFEASTSYHRLSGEIVTYCAALILGLRGERLDSARSSDICRGRFRRALRHTCSISGLNGRGISAEHFWEGLLGAGLFTVGIIKKSGEVPQIGDNDSGRFFRLSPNGVFLSAEHANKIYLNLENHCMAREYWDENALDHSTFLSALGGIFSHPALEEFVIRFPVERDVVCALAKGIRLDTVADGPFAYAKNQDTIAELQFRETTRCSFLEGKSLREGLETRIFYDFGLVVWKSERLYVAVFFGDVGQNGIGGHSHNDRLAIELSVDGRDVFRDPGTYVYTALPNRRNQFRSVEAHSGIVVDSVEQNSFNLGIRGLFRVHSETECGIIEVSNARIALWSRYKSIVHKRVVALEDHAVVVEDSCNHMFRVNIGRFRWYSNGYGKIEHAAV